MSEKEKDWEKAVTKIITKREQQTKIMNKKRKRSESENVFSKQQQNPLKTEQG
jgi:hypothetical protein